MAVTLVLGGTVGSLPAHAHLDAAPSRDELLAELNGLGRAVGDARARWDDAAALDPGRSAEILQQSQLALYAEDHERALGLLLPLLARQGIERDPGYVEALSGLGEALIGLGLQRAGTAELRRALEAPSTPTVYRYVLARYLAQAPDDEPMAQVRRGWSRYESERPATLEPEDREVRYLYARALYRGGARNEARALFSSIGEEDPFHLKALYHLAVLEVVEDDLRAARTRFEAAEAAWARRTQLLGGQASGDAAEWLDDVDDDGPALERSRIDADGESLVAEDEETGPVRRLDPVFQETARMGQVIRLSLARLLATQGELPAAVRAYRGIPPGSPDFPDATQELVWVLYRRGEHARCARAIDLLLAGRGDDRTFAELAVWKAHMFAMSADYTTAQAEYERLEQVLLRRRDDLDAVRSNLDASPRLFPEAVLAWNEPSVAARARGLEATLVEQTEALEEATEMLDALRVALTSSDALPAVRIAREVLAQLRGRFQTFLGRLGRARAVMHRASDDAASAPHGGGAPASADDVARLEQSAGRLEERLSKFATALDAAEVRWRSRIQVVLEAEAPALDAQRARLQTETEATRKLGRALALEAWVTLDRFAADAHYRQVDLVYWRKDEVTRRIRALRKEQKVEFAPMNEEVREYWDELRRMPIRGFTPP